MISTISLPPVNIGWEGFLAEPLNGQCAWTGWCSFYKCQINIASADLDIRKQKKKYSKVGKLERVMVAVFVLLMF